MPEKDFYQVSLKLILKNNQGEILILKALSTGIYNGYYDLPGGRIDTNETKVDFKDIILRELHEELGDIQVSFDLKPVAVARHLSTKIDQNGRTINVLCVFFEGFFEGGEIILSDEHLDYKWVDLTKIKLEDYFISAALEGIKMYLA